MRRTLSVLSVGLLALAIPQSSPAFVSLGPPARILDGSQDRVPDVAYDGLGTHGMVVSRNGELYFARSTDGGTVWSPPVLVADPIQTSDALFAGLASVVPGTWVAAWTSERLSGSSRNLYYARSTDDGQSWSVAGGPIRVADRGEGLFAIASDGVSTVIIAFSGLEDPAGPLYSDYDILYIRSSDGGVTWTAPTLLGLRADLESWPVVAFEPSSGAWVAAWVSVQGVQGSGFQILSARSSDGGVTWTAPVAITPSEPYENEDLFPQLAAGANGTLMLVWVRNTLSDDPGLYFTRSTDGGLTWSAAAELSAHTATRYIRFAPGIDTDGQGRWVVAFSSFAPLNSEPHGDDDDIFWLRSEDDGLSWSSVRFLGYFPDIREYALFGGTTRDRSVRVVADGAGDWLAVWSVDVHPWSYVLGSRSQCWTCAGPVLACTPDQGAACDDGDVCTVASECSSSGECDAGTVAVTAEPLCRWGIVVGQEKSKLRANSLSDLDNGVCTTTAKVGQITSIHGSLVATATSGTKGAVFSGNAHPAEHVVTGGAGVRTLGAGTLPHAGVASIAGGSIVPKYGGGVYDTTGTHPLLAQCLDAKNGLPALATFLDSLPANDSIGKMRIASADVVTLLLVPGAVNVVDAEQISIGRDATLVLDAGGDADTVAILRVETSVKLSADAEIALAGGLTAERTMIYAGKRVSTSPLSRGAGSILVPLGTVTLKNSTHWTGAIGAGRSVKVGTDVNVPYAPFLGL